jgi:hypothetical protein
MQRLDTTRYGPRDDSDWEEVQPFGMLRMRQGEPVQDSLEGARLAVPSMAEGRN